MLAARRCKRPIDHHSTFSRTAEETGSELVCPQEKRQVPQKSKSVRPDLRSRPPYDLR